MQGHNAKTCKWSDQKKKKAGDHKNDGGKAEKEWVRKSQVKNSEEKETIQEQSILIFQKGETSRSAETMVIAEESKELKKIQVDEVNGFTEGVEVIDGVELQVMENKKTDEQAVQNINVDDQPMQTEKSDEDPELNNTISTIREEVEAVQNPALVSEVFLGEVNLEKLDMIIGECNEEIRSDLNVVNEFVPNSSLEREEGEIQICSESEIEESLQHLARGKGCLSESDLHVETEINRKKAVKIRGSSRVKSKPSRLDL